MIEDERVAHEEKLRRMNEDMEEVFTRKVEEKEDRMRRLERDESNKLDQERKYVQEEKVRKIENIFSAVMQ